MCGLGTRAVAGLVTTDVGVWQASRTGKSCIAQRNGNQNSSFQLTVALPLFVKCMLFTPFNLDKCQENNTCTP